MTQRNSVLTPPATRLMRGVKFDLNTGCWMWAFGGVRNYGRLRVKGKKILAHRLSHLVFIGPIPKGMCVCHSCDNPGCINPLHLFLGTHQDNMRDMARKGRAKVIPKFGAMNPHAKLDDSAVTNIRKLVAAGALQQDVARQYDISFGQVSKIIRRDNWKHLDEVER